MKKVTLIIRGMHCASCASNIERSLKKTPGVNSASISVLLKKGTVEVEDNVQDKALSDAVSRAGYKVVEIKK